MRNKIYNIFNDPKYRKIIQEFQTRSFQEMLSPKKAPLMITDYAHNPEKHLEETDQAFLRELAGSFTRPDESLAMVNELLELGVDPHAIDKATKQSAFNIALEAGNFELMSAMHNHAISRPNPSKEAITIKDHIKNKELTLKEMKELPANVRKNLIAQIPEAAIEKEAQIAKAVQSQLVALSRFYLPDKYAQEMVKNLFEKNGVNPYAIDESTGKSAFDISKESENLPFIKALHANYPSAESIEAITALEKKLSRDLLIAVLNSPNEKDNIEMLLRKGANPHAIDETIEKSAFDIVTRRKDLELMKLMNNFQKTKASKQAIINLKEPEAQAITQPIELEPSVSTPTLPPTEPIRISLEEARNFKELAIAREKEIIEKRAAKIVIPKKDSRPNKEEQLRIQEQKLRLKEEAEQLKIQEKISLKKAEELARQERIAKKAAIIQAKEEKDRAEELARIAKKTAILQAKTQAAVKKILPKEAVITEIDDLSEQFKNPTITQVSSPLFIPVEKIEIPELSLKTIRVTISPISVIDGNSSPTQKTAIAIVYPEPKRVDTIAETPPAPKKTNRYQPTINSTAIQSTDKTPIIPAGTMSVKERMKAFQKGH